MTGALVYRLSATMRRLLEVIKDLELSDLHLQGGVYTRRGDQPSQAQARQGG